MMDDEKTLQPATSKPFKSLLVVVLMSVYVYIEYNYLLQSLQIKSYSFMKLVETVYWEPYIKTYFEFHQLISFLIPAIIYSYTFLCFPSDQLKLISLLSYLCISTALTSLFQMLYQQPRPFWYTSLKTSSCPQSFGSPSLILVIPFLSLLLLLLPSSLLKLILLLPLIILFQLFTSSSQLYLNSSSFDQTILSSLFSLFLFSLYPFLFQSLLYNLFRYSNQNIHNSTYSQPYLSSQRIRHSLLLLLISFSLITILPLLFYFLNHTLQSNYIKQITSKCIHLPKELQFDINKGLFIDSFYHLSLLITPFPLALGILLRSQLFGDFILTNPSYKSQNKRLHSLMKAILILIIYIGLYQVFSSLDLDETPYMRWMFRECPLVFIGMLLYIGVIPFIFYSVGLTGSLDTNDIQGYTSPVFKQLT